MATIRAGILNLIVARVIFVLDHLFPSPSFLTGDLLGPPPLVTGLMPIVERTFLGNYLAGVRVDKISISCLGSRILDRLSSRGPEIYPTRCRIPTTQSPAVLLRCRQLHR
jgi:hypothetical protein